MSVLAGRSFAADSGGCLRGSRHGRGLRKESVRTVISTPIPPAIALSGFNMNLVGHLMGHPHQTVC